MKMCFARHKATGRVCTHTPDHKGDHWSGMGGFYFTDDEATEKTKKEVR